MNPLTSNGTQSQCQVVCWISAQRHNLAPFTGWIGHPVSCHFIIKDQKQVKQTSKGQINYVVSVTQIVLFWMFLWLLWKLEWILCILYTLRTNECVVFSNLCTSLIAMQAQLRRSKKCKTKIPYGSQFQKSET